MRWPSTEPGQLSDQDADSTATQRALAVGLVLSVTLVAFETTAVLTALPTITDELDGLVPLRRHDRRVHAGRPRRAGVVRRVGRPVRRAPALPRVHRDVRRRPGRRGNGAVDGVRVVGRLLQGAGSGGFAPLVVHLGAPRVPARPAGDDVRLPQRRLGAAEPDRAGASPASSPTAFGWRWVFIGIIPLAVHRRGAHRHGRWRRWPRRSPTRRSRPSRLPRAIQAASGVGLVALGLQSRNVVVAVAVVRSPGSPSPAPRCGGCCPPGVFRRQTRTARHHRRAVPRHGDVPRRRQLRAARRRPPARSAPDRAGLRHRRRGAGMDRRAGDRGPPGRAPADHAGPRRSGSRCCWPASPRAAPVLDAGWPLRAHVRRLVASAASASAFCSTRRPSAR